MKTWPAETVVPWTAGVGPTSPVPSPKFQVTVCASSVPGSVKLAEKMSACPRTPGLGLGPVTGATTGATLLTVTVVPAVPEAPWLSVTVTVTG